MKRGKNGTGDRPTNTGHRAAAAICVGLPKFHGKVPFSEDEILEMPTDVSVASLLILNFSQRPRLSVSHLEPIKRPNASGVLPDQISTFFSLIIRKNYQEGRPITKFDGRQGSYQAQIFTGQNHHWSAASPLQRPPPDT